jgi:hypothetical protein
VDLMSFLQNAYDEHLDRAERLAGKEDSMPRRIAVLRALQRDSRDNAVVPVLVLRNREAFVSYYAAYTFSREHGRLPGAPEFVAPHMLHLFNLLHDAMEEGRQLTREERVVFLATANSVSAKVPESFFAVDLPLSFQGNRAETDAFDLAVA